MEYSQDPFAQHQDLSYILNELGEDRDAYFNAVAPPIMQTSNFAFRTVADLRTAFKDEMGGYLYSRGLNPTVDILRKKLAALDGADDGLVFANGAAAIFAGVLANVKSGDHIISVRNAYSWAQRMFDVVLPRFGVTTTYIDGRTIGAFEEARRPNTTFIYLESPSSWAFELQPLREVASFAKAAGIVTLIDNSYCTPLNQQPYKLGIDLCMQTATKYIGGHSDTLGGVLTGSSSMIKKIFDSEYLNVGSGISPFNAWLLLRGLRTLPMRLERTARTTRQVVEYLQAHPKIGRVNYPGDPSFAQAALAGTQMKSGGALFTFTIKGGTAASITKFCDELQHILMAVSWGGHESLIIPKCAGFEPELFKEEVEEHGWIRMYCGLEEPQYLMKDLDRALAKI